MSLGISHRVAAISIALVNSSPQIEAKSSFIFARSAACQVRVIVTTSRAASADGSAFWVRPIGMNVVYDIPKQQIRKRKAITV